MKKVAYLLLIFIVACGESAPTPEPIVISASDFTVSISENPSQDQIIGTISATTNGDNLTFSIVSQTPADAFTINQATGQLSVSSIEAFDFEVNQIITGEVRISNSEASENVNITITVNDENEDVIFNGNVSLKSQEEVEEFGAEGYTHVTGILAINGEYQISKLNSLNSLKSVGSLELRGNYNITDLSGLENLTTISDYNLLT